MLFPTSTQQPAILHFNPSLPTPSNHRIIKLLENFYRAPSKASLQLLLSGFSGNHYPGSIPHQGMQIDNVLMLSSLLCLLAGMHFTRRDCPSPTVQLLKDTCHTGEVGCIQDLFQNSWCSKSAPKVKQCVPICSIPKNAQIIIASMERTAFLKITYSSR